MSIAESLAYDLGKIIESGDVGEPAVYSRGEDFVDVSVIFADVGIDDMISEHAIGDACICLIQETELDTLVFQMTPERGDTITRTLPETAITIDREEEWEVVTRKRHTAGYWRLGCQKRMRVLP